MGTQGLAKHVLPSVPHFTGMCVDIENSVYVVILFNVSAHICVCMCMYVKYIYTVLSVNEYTPFEK